MARKKVPKKARGTATLAVRPAVRNSQISAFRALPCPALVFAQACQSLTAFGSCAHWAHAPSRPKLRPAVAPSGLSSSSVRFAHPPGKSLLLPILPTGLATSRVIKLDSYPQRLCALLCSPISAVKMGGPFSLRCLSPLGSPAGGAGQTQMAVLGIVSCYVGGLAASMGRPVFQFAVGVNHIQIMLVGRFDVTWIFLQGKRPA